MSSGLQEEFFVGVLLGWPALATVVDFPFDHKAWTVWCRWEVGRVHQAVLFFGCLLAPSRVSPRSVGFHLVTRPGQVCPDGEWKKFTQEVLVFGCLVDTGPRAVPDRFSIWFAQMESGQDLPDGAGSRLSSQP